jgi:type IV pilus assembly protein PilY1
MQPHPFNDLLAEHKTNYASSGSHYLDDVAYWAHTTDLRPCSGTTDGTIAGLSVTGHCIAGTQSLTVYSFFRIRQHQWSWNSGPSGPVGRV